MQEHSPQVIDVSHSSDMIVARHAAKAMAQSLGFDDRATEEIVIAASELASNLATHAAKGTLALWPLTEDGRTGIQMEALDEGPGIPDVEQALTDGFSTAGSLGYGLGTVNRLMDEFDVSSARGPSTPPDMRGDRQSPFGTRVVCRRWLRQEPRLLAPCPLDFGAASRPRPGAEGNGDAFVIKRWEGNALVAVIDGLGHGPFAERAARAARLFVETHCDRPLQELFRGVSRACRATRGCVMAVARFDWAATTPTHPHITLSFASVGNVEARVFNSPAPLNFIVRRGVLGLNAPDQVVSEHDWEPHCVLVLHSDGLGSHWRWSDYPDLADASATLAAQRLLRSQAKDADDATVLVVRSSVR